MAASDALNSRLPWFNKKSKFWCIELMKTLLSNSARHRPYRRKWNIIDTVPLDHFQTKLMIIVLKRLLNPNFWIIFDQFLHRITKPRTLAENPIPSLSKDHRSLSLCKKNPPKNKTKRKNLNFIHNSLKRAGLLFFIKRA